MKILEDTAERLTLTMGIPWFNGSRCTFDKSTGLGRIERVIFFWRCKPDEIVLSDITDVTVGETSTTEGGTSSFPVLQFKSRKPLYLPCADFGGKSVAPCVERIRAFIGPPGKSLMAIYPPEG